MEVICINCKQLAKISCYCNILLRFCYECYIFHKDTQVNHDCINLDKTIQKIHSDAKKEFESFSFSTNFTEI